MKLAHTYRVCLALIVLGWAAGAMAQAPTTGVVVDIKDPEGLGRVKVVDITVFEQAVFEGADAIMLSAESAVGK